VFDSVLNYMDKFGPELLVIQFGFLVILSTLFLWLWFSNRRKYHNLKHAIPANVVKNYLDSIIQNSTSLKSSLFRGGGLETDSVPSVMPLTNLMGGEGLGVSGAPSTALLEEINQKKAMIASLEAQLATLQGSQREIESKLSSSERDLSSARIKIKELEALLAQTKEGSNVDAALQSELTMVTKERDDIRNRLKEFEIIADDLANLKRLQQENEQLKRSLAAQGNAPATAVETDSDVAFNQADVSDLLEDLGQSDSGSDDNSALEDFLSSPDEVSASEPEAPAAEENASNSNKPKSEKTPEDLLSEFEKMLG
jgi:hypothetical protein